MGATSCSSWAVENLTGAAAAGGGVGGGGLTGSAAAGGGVGGGGSSAAAASPAVSPTIVIATSVIMRLAPREARTPRRARVRNGFMAESQLLRRRFRFLP